MKKIKHYSCGKKGIIEVRPNWRHKCIERCDTIKIVNKLIFLLEELKVILKGQDY